MTTNYLAEVYSSISERVGDPNMPFPTLRAIMAESTKCASEPSGVTYEDGKAKNISVMWVKPVDADPNRVILYFHGGGFVVGSTETHRKMVGHLAKASKSYALILDYRLAPENPFPAQMEDAVAAYGWLIVQGYKPANIVTAGDSAGGNLAVSSVVKMKQDGKNLPAATVSISPWFDMEADQQTGSMKTNSEKDKLVQAPVLGMMAGLFMGEKGNKRDPVANPLLGELKGLPPAYVAVSKDETLYDDAMSFVQAAKKSGVEVELEEVVGHQHVWTFMAGKHAEADKTIANIGRWLQTKI